MQVVKIPTKVRAQWLVGMNISEYYLHKALPFQDPDLGLGYDTWYHSSRIGRLSVDLHHAAPLAGHVGQPVGLAFSQLST